MTEPSYLAAAVTVRNALNGMLMAIDHGAKDSVYVMVVEDGIDIAGMGGLMGTAMYSREFAGAVIDGGVRDVAYLKKIGFPVYALGIVPSTSIHHYRFSGSNIPVVCDGVEVNAADIVVADQDGVVVVPPRTPASRESPLFGFNLCIWRSKLSSFWGSFWVRFPNVPCVFNNILASIVLFLCFSESCLPARSPSSLAGKSTSREVQEWPTASPSCDPKDGVDGWLPNSSTL